MSGGYFDYNQNRIFDIADEVSKLIRTNNDATLDEWGDRKGNFYGTEVIAHFREGVEALERAAIYAQRIDWLVSGDDSPEAFIERLVEEITHGRTPTVQIDDDAQEAYKLGYIAGRIAGEQV